MGVPTIVLFFRVLQWPGDDLMLVLAWLAAVAAVVARISVRGVDEERPALEARTPCPFTPSVSGEALRYGNGVTAFILQIPSP